MPSNFRREVVSTVPKIIASYNKFRKLLMIINESEYTVYVSKDPQNVVELGIPLFPYESIVFDIADADAPEEAFFAATDAGAAAVRIYESVVSVHG